MSDDKDEAWARARAAMHKFQTADGKHQVTLPADEAVARLLGALSRMDEDLRELARSWLESSKEIRSRATVAGTVADHHVDGRSIGASNTLRGCAEELLAMLDEEPE